MLDDYLVFARIVETGSFSAAARALHVSTSHVSKRLAALEQRIGVRLVHRSTRRVLVTGPGEQFYAEVAAILVQSQQAEDIAAGREGPPSGRLRISSAILTGRRYVSPSAPSFLKLYPKVKLEIDLDDEFVDLQKGQYDLAIRMSGAIDEKGLVGHLLGTNRRILCCAASYLEHAEPPQSVADLGRHHLLGAVSQFPWGLEGPDGVHIVRGESLVRTNASEVVRDLLLGGLGIALRSPWDVSDELASGQVVRLLPLYRGAADVGVYAVHRDEAHVPAVVSAFIEHIKPAFRWLLESPDVPSSVINPASLRD